MLYVHVDPNYLLYAQVIPNYMLYSGVRSSRSRWHCCRLFVRLIRFFHGYYVFFGVVVVYVLNTMCCHSNMVHIQFLVVIEYAFFVRLTRFFHGYDEIISLAVVSVLNITFCCVI